MPWHLRVVTALVCVAVVGPRVALAQTQADPLQFSPESVKTLAALIANSGTDAQPVREGVWRVIAGGDHYERFAVLVSVYNQYVLTQSVALETPTLTPAQLRQLLEINYDKDLAKIAIDPDGDVSVLNETELAALDGPRLGRIVRAVASVVDIIYGRMAPSAPPMPAVEDYAPLALTTSPGPALAGLSLPGGAGTLRYDPAVWTVVDTGAPTEQRLQHATADVVLVVDAAPACRMDDEGADAVLARARRSTPDARVTRRGRRLINGQPFVAMDLEATLDGVPLTILAHCHAGGPQAVTLLGLAATDIMDDYRAALDRLVAGVELTGRR